MSSTYADSYLTKTDLDNFQRNKTKYYKTTIAVSATYGTLALALFLLAVFSDKGRDILAGDLLLFTVTLLGGLVVVVICLVAFVMSAKPVHIDLKNYDYDKCPDYWKMVPADQGDLDSLDASIKYLHTYKCVPQDATRYPNAAATIPSTNVTDTKLRNAMFAMSHPTVTGGNTLSCNKLFPQYLSKIDSEYAKDNKLAIDNNIRCQMAKHCGFSWSSTCPIVS